MRLRKRQMRKYYLKPQISKKDNEGASYVEYGVPFAFMADISPASGKTQAELYGIRLTNILNMILSNEIILNEGVGVCVYVDPDNPPDYKIISIKRYTSHMSCELEKVT